MYTTLYHELYYVATCFIYYARKTVANLATKVDKYDSLNMTHVCKNTLNKYRHKFSKYKYKFIKTNSSLIFKRVSCDYVYVTADTTLLFQS
jgi:hypothetical protein